MRKTYRQLQPGESPPRWEPYRYRADRGYIRLRWKVAPYTYVEVYEHRFRLGCPKADVHHKNEVKSDNETSNLTKMNRSTHMREHRGCDWNRVVSLYSSGLTMPQVASAMGINHGTVSRVLRRLGLPARRRGQRV